MLALILRSAPERLLRLGTVVTTITPALLVLDVLTAVARDGRPLSAQQLPLRRTSWKAVSRPVGWVRASSTTARP